MNLPRRKEETESPLTSQRNSNRTSESHQKPAESILKMNPKRRADDLGKDVHFKREFRLAGSGEKGSKENAAPERIGLSLLENQPEGLSHSRSKRSSGGELRSNGGKENSIAQLKGGSRTSMISGAVEGLNSRDFGSGENLGNAPKTRSHKVLGKGKNELKKEDQTNLKKIQQLKKIPPDIFIAKKITRGKKITQEDHSWKQHLPAFGDNSYQMNQTHSMTQCQPQMNREPSQPHLNNSSRFNQDDYQAQTLRTIQMELPKQKPESMPENYEQDLVVSNRKIIHTSGTPTNTRDRFFYPEALSNPRSNISKSPNLQHGFLNLSSGHARAQKAVNYSFNRVHEVENQRSRGSSYYDGNGDSYRKLNLNISRNEPNLNNEPTYNPNQIFRNETFGEKRPFNFQKNYHAKRNIFENSQVTDNRELGNSRLNPVQRQNLIGFKQSETAAENRQFFIRQKQPSSGIYRGDVNIQLESLRNQKIDFNPTSSQEIFQQRHAFDKMIQEKMKKLRDLVDERKSYLQEMEDLNGMMEQAIHQHKKDIQLKIEDFNAHMRKCNMPPYSDRSMISQDLGLLNNKNISKSKSLGGSLAQSPNIHAFARKIARPTPTQTPNIDPTLPKFPADFNNEMLANFDKRLSPARAEDLGSKSPHHQYEKVDLEYIQNYLGKREKPSPIPKPRTVFKIDLAPKLEIKNKGSSQLKRVKEDAQMERVNYKNPPMQLDPKEPIDIQSLDTGDQEGSKKANSESRGMRRSQRIKNRKRESQMKIMTHDIPTEYKPQKRILQLPTRQKPIPKKPKRYDDDDEDFTIEKPKRKKKARKRDRRRKPLTLEDNNPNKVVGVSCKCKKSKCLKLYCDCFASGGMCGPACKCTNCCNNEEYSGLREAVRKEMLRKNPKAFQKKFKKVKTKSNFLHSRGCNCKKTQCIKNYCECFSVGVGCSVLCKCINCKNKKIEIAPEEAGKYFEKPERRRRKSNLVFKFFFNHLRDQGNQEILAKVNSVLEKEGFGASLGNIEEKDLNLTRMREIIGELGLSAEFEEFKIREQTGKVERSVRTEGRMTPTISPEFDDQILLEDDDPEDDEDGFAQTLEHFKRLRKE